MVDIIDVAVVGGGPAGLSARLALGRARRRVTIFDGGVRRNLLARHLHNFVTQDGITPAEFRRTAVEQLRQYPTVVHREALVQKIVPCGAHFEVVTGGELTYAKRILLCPGMIDEPMPIEGFARAWGHAIFQCPYCHGFEHRDQRWGYVMQSPESLDFALQLRSWTEAVTIFVGEGVALVGESERRLLSRGFRIERRPILELALRGQDTGPLDVTLADGAVVQCDVLFAHPKQSLVPLVRELGLALDEQGFVAIDAHMQTSMSGVYAAGDSTTRMQAAIFAAAAGTRAAVVMHHELATA